MNKKEKEYRKRILIGFIDHYLNKRNIKMKDLLTNLKAALNTKGKISIKQFDAIMRFLERERLMKNKSKDEIRDYFSPFLIGYIKGEKNVSNTLY